MRGFWCLTKRVIIVLLFLTLLGRRLEGAVFFFGMKWVLVRDGSYKYVTDDDARPSVVLPNKPLGSIFIPYNPSWKKYESEMWNDDKKRSIPATDKFIDEREHETRTDPKAARWEKSRKERVAKDKPAWVKWAKQRGYYDH